MIQSFPVIIIVPLSFIVTIIRKITIIIIVIVIKSTSYPWLRTNQGIMIIINDHGD